MKFIKPICHLIGMPLIYILSILLLCLSAFLSVMDGCVAVILHAFHRFEFWSANTPMLSVICDPRLKSYGKIFKEAYTGEAESYIKLYAQEEKRQQDAYHANH